MPHSGLEACGSLCDCFEYFVDVEDGGHCIEPRKNGRFEAGFDHEVDGGAGCGHCSCCCRVALLLSCNNNPIRSFRQWLHIGDVDNNNIESWVATANTLTAADLPSRQKVRMRRSTWKVERVSYPRMGPQVH